MKWDIWFAHYPMHVIVSDAIKAGTIPIWNPLYNMGTPYYAMVGTPVWYPFTLFFDLIGYTPISPAWEYCLHIFIGAIGMYCLSNEEFSEDRSTKYIVSFLLGLLYSFSGTYLSNAEHIMIIISISWLPWILMYERKFLITNEVVYLFVTIVCVSMIFLGGYPEIFYNCFLIIPVWGILVLREYPVIRRIVSSIKASIFIGIGTIAASAISLIPFVHIMSRITRSGGQNVGSNPFAILFSMIIPVAAESIEKAEPSMGSMYMGILIVLLIPFAAKSTKNARKNYLFIGLMLLFLSFGQNSFIHTILYRFLPMYSTFRFASLWRPFSVIFILLGVGDYIEEVLESFHDETKILVISLMKLICMTLGGTFILWCTEMFVDEEKRAFISLVVEALILLLIVSVAYYLFFSGLNSRRRRTNYILLGAIVAFECLAIAYKYFPYTIAMYSQTAYATDSFIKESIDKEWDDYENRVVACDFANNDRSKSGFDSRQLALNKTFDSEGYLSVKLASIDYYKGTENFEITKNNPEIYFTNDIVELEGDELVSWLNDKNVKLSQVAVNEYDYKLDSEIIMESVHTEHFGFNSLSFSYDAKSDGIVTILQAYYPGWKLYVDGKPADIAKVDGCFMGVPLKKGQHDVVMKFRPMDLYIGAALTILFYISFVGVIVGRRRNGRWNKQKYSR